MLFHNEKRFNEFLHSVEDINPNTLATRLREMERNNLIERKIFYKSPVRIEYHLTESSMTEGLKELLADSMTFSGPLMHTSNVKKYLQMLGQFGKFHDGIEMFRQFENGDDACSIYQMNLKTPSGGSFSAQIADWIKMSGGKIVEQKNTMTLGNLQRLLECKEK